MGRPCGSRRKASTEGQALDTSVSESGGYGTANRSVRQRAPSQIGRRQAAGDFGPPISGAARPTAIHHGDRIGSGHVQRLLSSGVPAGLSTLQLRQPRAKALGI